MLPTRDAAASGSPKHFGTTRQLMTSVSTALIIDLVVPAG